MAVKSYSALLQSVALLIRSGGNNGKTTAAEARALFRDLIDTMFSISSKSEESLDWKNDITYSLEARPYSIYNLRLFRTKSDGNLNNTPPIMPNQAGEYENDFWIEVSAANASAIQKWAAGVYTQELAIVYKNHKLYELDTVTRPFESIDFEAELRTEQNPGGAWLELGGGQKKPNTNFYYVDSFGAGVNKTGAENTAAIQQAIDAAGILGGGTVIINGNGIYNLNNQGVNPYRNARGYCLDIKYDNIALIISPQTTLRLANGQQTNTTGGVNIIVFGKRNNIEISGGGKIIGNTSGQTGWTGGYQQNDAGNLIASFHHGVSSTYKNININNLTLEDHFSNPINLGLWGTEGADGTIKGIGITIKDIKVDNCGEGIQVIDCENVHFSNLIVTDTKGIAVGDGIELARCNRFSISDCKVYNFSGSAAGAAFDIFASKNGTIINIQADVCKMGMTLETTFNAPFITSDNIVIDNVLFTNCQTGILAGDGEISYNNVTARNCTYGFQIRGASTLPAVTVSNPIIRGGTVGFLISGGRRAIINNPTISGCSGNGVDIRSTTGQTYTGTESGDIKINGGTITVNGLMGVRYTDQGISSFRPTGLLNGVDCSGNAGDPMFLPTTFKIRNCELGTASNLSLMGRYNEILNFGNITLNPLPVINTPDKHIIRLRLTTNLSKTFSVDSTLSLKGGVGTTLTQGESLDLQFDAVNSIWREISRLEL